MNRLILSHPERGAIAKSCRVMAGKEDVSGNRKDLVQTRIRRDAEAVQAVQNTFVAMVDSFSCCDEELVGIFSGIVVEENIKLDLLQAQKKGAASFDVFNTGRLFTGTKNFFHPIKTLRLKTFVSSWKRTVSTKVQGDSVNEGIGR